MTMSIDLGGPMAGDSAGGHNVTTGVWIVTVVIMIGTILGGVGLIEWWLGPVFWIGVGLIVAGGIGGYFTGIMDMVTEYSPVTAAEPEHH
jgi:hypothetical protein